ncbi:hypothetical protein MFMK1_000156 [Metallumcola ferriviriculae]|uniref:Uncharacterized protein n=1 Tax=Metallumcola ferriviriculae TaxID=3039180 RepID=A0AAU0UHL1_9FIRM|nr:hypothetical protein MFMK1_000156 [Desulfitibacteraceae bacterium MK1]
MAGSKLPAELVSVYLSLPWEDKTLWDRYSLEMPAENAVTYLHILVANLIPQGHYSLAKHLLYKALTFPSEPAQEAWLYANLYQIAADQQQPLLCREYCEKVLATGHLSQWAKNTISDLPPYS